MTASPNKIFIRVAIAIPFRENPRNRLGTVFIILRKMLLLHVSELPIPRFGMEENGMELHKKMFLKSHLSVFLCP